MMLQYSEITQSRVFDGAKLESEHVSLDFIPFYRHLEKKMDWWVHGISATFLW